MTFLSRIGFALSAMVFVSCSAVTGSKITMEELRGYYGLYENVFKAAVLAENPEHIEAVLDFGVSEKDFYTAILKSAHKNYKVSMDVLLEYGKNNIEDFVHNLDSWVSSETWGKHYWNLDLSSGMTAYEIAVLESHTYIVRKFLEYGVTVDSQSSILFTNLASIYCDQIKDLKQVEYSSTVNYDTQTVLEEFGFRLPTIEDFKEEYCSP